MIRTPRATAAKILLKIEQDKAYSNLALDSVLREEKLDARDASFVSALVYGVTERKITLDYELSFYLKQPVKKLHPEVAVILRMGVYQLLFMDKIPASAAINESVKLIKNGSQKYASGLVNGVLRNVQRYGKLHDYSSMPFTKRLSIEYSCPKWLIKLWSEAYGKENAEKLCAAALGKPPLTVRVNIGRSSAEDLKSVFTEQGMECKTVEDLENALILNKTGSLEQTESYKQGLFHVQDSASQLCCKALDAKPGDTVLDMCSSPGGKAFTIAQMMENKGLLQAMDLYPARCNLIEQGARRLGLTVIKTRTADASVHYDDLPEADRILCDVPCSGLGIIRRKPEIRYKSKEDIDNLPDLQYRILKNCSEYLKVGGKLVYSTCTLNPAENEEVCDRFLNENPDFKKVEVLKEIPRARENEPYLTLMPHINNTDGFFIASFERVR